ncbi:MAG TPA: phospholipase D-like domain-containing protein [Gemmatimonadaceae bacterium]|nr:phospholipase D-like domain-containing protein [Gemmatimonadaceae bacterium]
MHLAHDRLRIICPFIKLKVVERLLERGSPGSIEVLTRFDTLAFAEGVSDAEAMGLLLEHGAKIRGIQNLHAKVYHFGLERVIVTSANLTRAALRSNHEFGFVADDPEVLDRCTSYFEELWVKAGDDLTAERVEGWKEKVYRYRLRGAPPHPSGLGDEGKNIGLPYVDRPVVSTYETGFRSFIKFFGDAGNRADRSLLVRDEVARAGCHWACTYPRGKRPRQVEDGSVVFMGRLVRNQPDIFIFGRAIGLAHQPGRDDASPGEIKRREWKLRWPHYVRVHHAEFIDGVIGGGASLNEMMKELESKAFMSTWRNAKAGEGNANPRRAYMRRAEVELTLEGYQWLSERLDDAFMEHGKLPDAVLAKLDWPE